MSIDYMVIDETRIWLDNEDEDTIHTVCDVDERWAMCGANVELDPWEWESTTPSHDCDACEEFDRADFCAHCAMGES